MQVDLSKVAKLAERNEAVRLYEKFHDLESDDAASEAIEEAWEQFNNVSVGLLTDEIDGTVRRCAISGVPLIDSDETVEVLACFLPVPSGICPDGVSEKVEA